MISGVELRVLWDRGAQGLKRTSLSLHEPRRPCKRKVPARTPATARKDLLQLGFTPQLHRPELMSATLSSGFSSASKRCWNIRLGAEVALGIAPEVNGADLVVGMGVEVLEQAV